MVLGGKKSHLHLAPLLTLFLAQIIGSVFNLVHDKGFKACFVGFVMGFLKMIPGVQNYIDAEKPKIGFSAPQGCGKTTLVFALDYLFKTTKRKSATISIDDSYLTAEGQAELRDTNPGNALLEYRGNAEKP